jgi:hypothetical protein
MAVRFFLCGVKEDLWRGSLLWRGGLPPLDREAVPKQSPLFTWQIYDCFAAERGDAAFRQAPSPQWFTGHKSTSTPMIFRTVAHA